MLTMLRLVTTVHRTPRLFDRGRLVLTFVNRVILSAASFLRVSARQAQWLDQQLNLLVLILETTNKITESHWMMRLTALAWKPFCLLFLPLFVEA